MGLVGDASRLLSNTWQATVGAATTHWQRPPSRSQRAAILNMSDSQSYMPQAASSLEEEGLLYHPITVRARDNIHGFQEEEGWIDKTANERQGDRSQNTFRTGASYCPQSSSLPDLRTLVTTTFDVGRHAQNLKSLACLSLVSLESLFILVCLCRRWDRLTSVHLYLAATAGFVSWTLIQWIIIGYLTCSSVLPTPALPSSSQTSPPHRWPRSYRVLLFTSTILSLAVCFGSTPASLGPLPALIATDPNIPERYFIAANLYNSEKIFPQWSTQLLLLCEHLGPSNVFISIAESNSKDSTKQLLRNFDNLLTALEIDHRVTLEDNKDRWWPTGGSPERTQYLAGVRNKALEPLQSPDDTVRLDNADSFTKLIFLNDIYYSWQSIVRLLATRLDDRTDLPPDYDLVCGLDFDSPGLYDTWVAHDVCGRPMRNRWPYTLDATTAELVKSERPFEVSVCWNGVVVAPAKPYTRSNSVRGSSHAALSSGAPKLDNLDKRGWRMMDNATYPHGLHSPPLSDPLKFRGSIPEDACEHSECFFFSYDIHRMLSGIRRPRILMNPRVKVAYNASWYEWHTYILRLKFVRFWLRIWSRGLPFKLLDSFAKYGPSIRDSCAWGGLQRPERCLPPPGPEDGTWWTG